MARIPPHIIDEIMQTSRIEEVIGGFVALKRAGSNLKGMSPFVDEKTPSFMVSPVKQIFKCFSSGKGGNVVAFLMEKEHFSYPEALKWLAEKYNIQLPADEPETADEIAQRTERESLYIINEFAKNHFYKTIHDTEEGRNVGLTYFEERGFRKDIIEKFQLGYCLNSGDDFTKAAFAAGYEKKYLEGVGLVKSKDDRYFDFFRGRVMFPIHSVSGRVLGFGGRTLFTDKKVAKYFNSPESIIYNKSEILYGLYYAKGDIVKYDNCFLCEGYTDVISMHQAGVANSVSSSGTSLTVQQIRLVKRYTKNITILYDGDAAGIKASFRGIDLILEEGLNVKVVLFPDGDDPDSYSKKVSSSEFMEFIQSNTKDFLTFKTDLLFQEGKDDPIKRSELIRDVVHSIALIPDQLTRSVYAQTVARQFGIEETIIIVEINKHRKQKLAKDYDEPEFQQIPEEITLQTSQSLTAQHQTEVPNKSSDSVEAFELIRVLLKYAALEIRTFEPTENGKPKEIVSSVAEIICQELLRDDLNFKSEIHQAIFQEIIDGLSQNTLYKNTYWLRHQNQEIAQLAAEIESSPHELSTQWLTKYNVDTQSEYDKINSTVNTALYAFKTKRVLEKIDEIHQKLIHTTDENEQINLLMEQVVYERVKMALAQKLGRTILG